MIRETFGTDFKRDALRADVLGSFNPEAVRADGRSGLRMSNGATRPELASKALARKAGLGVAGDRRRVLVVIPVAMLVTSILHPDTQMWRRTVGHAGARTRSWPRRCCSPASSTVSTVLGVALAWLVSAYSFPGRGVLSWALVLPLAMPGYILGFVTLSVFGVAGPIQTWWR